MAEARDLPILREDHNLNPFIPCCQNLKMRKNRLCSELKALLTFRIKDLGFTIYNEGYIKISDILQVKGLVSKLVTTAEIIDIGQTCDEFTIYKDEFIKFNNNRKSILHLTLAELPK